MPSLGNPLYKAVVKTTSGQEYDLYKLESYTGLDNI